MGRENGRTRGVKESRSHDKTEGDFDYDAATKQILDRLDRYHKQADDLSKEVGRMRLVNEQMALKLTEYQAASRDREDRSVQKASVENNKATPRYGSEHTGGGDRSNAGVTAERDKSRTCYSRGLPGHFSRNCPEKKRTNETDEGVRASKGVKAKDAPRMVYLDIEFHGGTKLSLLDTGSEVTLLPVELRRDEETKPVDQKVIAANGTDIGIIGMITTVAKIDGKPVEITGYLSRNVDEVIIGVDLLKQWECVWDFNSDKIRVLGNWLSLKSRSYVGACRRVILAERITIPPQSEIVAPAEIVFNSWTSMRSNATWIAECRQIKAGVYTASVIILARAVGIPLRLANVTRKHETLEEGIEIAPLVEVELCESANVDNDGTIDIKAGVRGLGAGAVRAGDSGAGVKGLGAGAVRAGDSGAGVRDLGAGAVRAGGSGVGAAVSGATAIGIVGDGVEITECGSQEVDVEFTGVEVTDSRVTGSVAVKSRMVRNDDMGGDVAENEDGIGTSVQKSGKHSGKRSNEWRSTAPA